jgi:hypothetical protein
LIGGRKLSHDNTSWRRAGCLRKGISEYEQVARHILRRQPKDVLCDRLQIGALDCCLYTFIFKRRHLSAFPPGIQFYGAEELKNALKPKPSPAQRR